MFVNFFFKSLSILITSILRLPLIIQMPKFWWELILLEFADSAHNELSFAYVCKLWIVCYSLSGLSVRVPSSLGGKYVPPKEFCNWFYQAPPGVLPTLELARSTNSNPKYTGRQSPNIWVQILTESLLQTSVQAKVKLPYSLPVTVHPFKSIISVKM